MFCNAEIPSKICIAPQVQIPQTFHLSISIFLVLRYFVAELVFNSLQINLNPTYSWWTTEVYFVLKWVSGKQFISSRYNVFFDKGSNLQCSKCKFIIIDFQQWYLNQGVSETRLWCHQLGIDLCSCTDDKSVHMATDRRHAIRNIDIIQRWIWLSYTYFVFTVLNFWIGGHLDPFMCERGLS